MPALPHVVDRASIIIPCYISTDIFSCGPEMPEITMWLLILMTSFVEE
jgi:hypothetical protein